MTKAMTDTIFSKIIKNEIPSDKIYENDLLLCIKDKYPKAPVHLLCIPKKYFKDYTDFIANETQENICIFFKTIAEIIEKQGLDNFKLITNNGEKAGQEIFHFHVHIMGYHS